MSVFVSRAQNFEDVMLWRALGHVERGFYVDLGAGEPDVDSVTLAFHERGWRGINVEPAPDAFRRLAAARPDDTNLNVAVGDAEGGAELFLVGNGNGLSTTDPGLARAHARTGWSTERVPARATTLARICAQHVRGPIHFLKIDVEGAELRALRGADFARWRPWIVLIEALDPASRQPNYAGCEDLLRQNGYRFAYFDGLNRFYVADEHAAPLEAAFAAPPNLWDNFVVDNAVAAARRRDAEARVAAVEGALRVDMHRIAEERDACVRDRQVAVCELREAVSRLTAEHDACARDRDAAMGALHGEVSRLTAERDACVREGAVAIGRLKAEVVRLAAERDGWMQELFESDRHAAHLARVRQDLTEEMVRERAAWSARLEGIRVSTSWRLTGPLRVLGRALGRRG